MGKRSGVRRIVEHLGSAHDDLELALLHQISTRGPIRLARQGMWSLQASETVPADLDAQVGELLGHLTPDLRAWRELADRFRVDIFCGWFMSRLNEGLQVSPGTLLALGERRVVLSLDIYGGDDEEAG